MKVNWDDDIPSIWENKSHVTCSKPPTSITIYDCVLHNAYIVDAHSERKRERERETKSNTRETRIQWNICMYMHRVESVGCMRTGEYKLIIAKTSTKDPIAISTYLRMFLKMLQKISINICMDEL